MLLSAVSKFMNLRSSGLCSHLAEPYAEIMSVDNGLHGTDFDDSVSISMLIPLIQINGEIIQMMAGQISGQVTEFAIPEDFTPNKSSHIHLDGAFS